MLTLYDTMIYVNECFKKNFIIAIKLSGSYREDIHHVKKMIILQWTMAASWCQQTN